MQLTEAEGITDQACSVDDKDIMPEPKAIEMAMAAEGRGHGRTLQQRRPQSSCIVDATGIRVVAGVEVVGQDPFMQHEQQAAAVVACFDIGTAKGDIVLVAPVTGAATVVEIGPRHAQAGGHINYI